MHRPLSLGSKALSIALLLGALAAPVRAAPPSAAEVERFAGMWHGSPVMPAGYVSNLMLFPEGRFYLDAHLDLACASPTQVPAAGAALGALGTWKVESRHVVLEVAYVHQAGPGTCPCSDPKELELVDHECYANLTAPRLVPWTGNDLPAKLEPKAFAGDAALGVPALDALHVSHRELGGHFYRSLGLGKVEYFQDVATVHGEGLLAYFGCRADGRKVACDVPVSASSPPAGFAPAPSCAVAPLPSAPKRPEDVCRLLEPSLEESTDCRRLALGGKDAFPLAGGAEAWLLQYDEGVMVTVLAVHAGSRWFATTVADSSHGMEVVTGRDIAALEPHAFGPTVPGLVLRRTEELLERESSAEPFEERFSGEELVAFGLVDGALYQLARVSTEAYEAGTRKAAAVTWLPDDQGYEVKAVAGTTPATNPGLFRLGRPSACTPRAPRLP